jgi:hypothetical protein
MAASTTNTAIKRAATVVGQLFAGASVSSSSNGNGNGPSTIGVVREAKDFIGQSKWSIPTPSLVLDLPRFEASITNM